MMQKLSYLRFVGAAKNGGLSSRRGFLQIAGEAVRAPETPKAFVDQIDRLRGWFGSYLAVPPRFRASASKGWRNDQPGISWFKSTAKLHISQAMTLKALLDEVGYPITILRERRIGYIVWEDEHQVVAEPFAETLR